ncbi:MAG: UbiD family decarboxylase [Chloroflexi bacterium]|nr:UbiD family decarboxylase [Chloroflexota bacterium]
MTPKVFNDLREYLDEVIKWGDYKIIEGADWNLEIGALTELQGRIPDSPMLIFDKIKGSEPGYRVVSNMLNTYKRIALALGLPLEARGTELVRAIRDKLREDFKPIPPVEVATGPVKENILTGDKIDLFKFPVPKWHEHDGGRYMAPGGMAVFKDPDEGWVNLGYYRIQLHDKDVATLHSVPRRQGTLIRNKYWARGQNAPVAVIFGEDPLLWHAGCAQPPWGVSEYDYAGWLRGKPIEVVKGEVTGLPIPAGAEIVLEGEMVAPGGETRVEGPMAEWAGYYATYPDPEQIFKIKAILHRDNPIMTGYPVNIGQYDLYHGVRMFMAASLWNNLDRLVPGIKGVWFANESPAGAMLIIVSVKQMFPGHAKRAGILASEAHDRVNRFVIVVDDDIDPSNISDVFWAMGSRCNPATAIDIINGCYSQSSDPLVSPEARKRGEYYSSKAIVYACKPYTWINQFPRSIKGDPELLERVRKKFLS